MKGGKSLKKLSIRFMPIAPKARRNRERIGRERERIFDGHQKAKSKYEQDSQGNTQATGVPAP
jgi:hypothetical protein